MVEFAIVLPLLLLVIVGLIEFGITFNSWLSLNHLSNEGARWAAVGRVPGNESPTGDQIKDYIKSQITTGGLKADVEGAGGYVRLCVPSATPHVGDPVTVEIGVNPYSIFKMTGFRLMDVNLSGSSTMRLEKAPPATPPPTTSGWTVC